MPPSGLPPETMTVSIVGAGGVVCAGVVASVATFCVAAAGAAVLVEALSSSLDPEATMKPTTRTTAAAATRARRWRGLMRRKSSYRPPGPAPERRRGGPEGPPRSDTADGSDGYLE